MNVEKFLECGVEEEWQHLPTLAQKKVTHLGYTTYVYAIFNSRQTNVRHTSLKRMKKMC